MNVLSLFSGIGAYDLGLERTGGFRTVAFCENEPFCVRILNKHWPHVPVYPDVRTLTADALRRDGIGFDALVGGFPCTDLSEAKQGAQGLDGDASGLWFEVERILREVGEPLAAVILENSTRLRSRGLDKILGALDALRYDAEWHCLTARAFNAPHERDRLWIVAYPHGHPPIWPAIARAERAAWPREPDVPRVAHGIADQSHRRRALGNTNPPVIIETIARAILAANLEASERGE